MLGISRHTDYALRIVLHLSSLDPERLPTIGDISQRRLLPAAFVRRIVAKLATAGLLATVRGASGGVRLARPASQITMLDVVEAMEGGIVLNRCVDTPRACPLATTCPVQRVWTGATRQVETYLASVTMQELALRVEPPQTPSSTTPARSGRTRRKSAEP